jgi:hypothetical protein
MNTFLHHPQQHEEIMNVFTNDDRHLTLDRLEQVSELASESSAQSFAQRRPSASEGVR